MRGLLTLDQELRAARMAKGQKNAGRPHRTPEPNLSDRPWQPDIDKLQQTMREVLRAVASLSGVELPGLPPGIDDDGATPPRLAITTLKDRFRNDLEGFSIKMTEELVRQAKEQTHAALDTVQNEVRKNLDQVAAEFREQLELPTHIEKLVEPSVEQVASRLEKSLCQKVEDLVAKHEQLVEDRLRGTISTVQAQISTLDQTVQQIHQVKADSAAQTSEDRVTVAEVAARMDQIVAEVREKLQDHVQIEKLVEPSVEQVASRLEKSLCQKVEDLVAKHEQLVENRLQGTISSVQAQIGTLEQIVQQIRTIKADSVAQLPAERPNAPVDEPSKEPETDISNGFNGFLDQAFSRIELSFSNLRDIARIQPAQVSVAGLENKSSGISFEASERERRVQQALDELGRLGTKNLHPVS